MISKHALVSLLLLSFYLAACNPQQKHEIASPAVTPSPQQPVVGISTSVAAISTAISHPTKTPHAAREFNEPFDSNPTHWSFVHARSGPASDEASIRDGFLVFNLTEANEWSYALFDAYSYPRVRIETDVQSRTPGDGSAGLVCNYDANKGWYEFNIFADGAYQLLYGQWLADGVVSYTPLYQGRSDAIRNDVNNIALQCQGNMLLPSINGLPLRQWPEAKFGLTSGQVGLSASAFSNVPYTAAFDWVKVSEP